MPDVSTSSLTDVVRFLELKGHDRKALLDPDSFPDFPTEFFDSSFLFKKSHSISWDTYATIFNSFTPYFTKDETIDEFYQWSFKTGAKWMYAIAPAAQLVLKPESLYRIVEWGTNVNFSNTTTKIDRSKSGRILFHVALRPNDIPSLLWFRFGQSCLKLIPTMLGFKPALSTLDSDGSTGVVTVLFPHSSSSVFRTILVRPFLMLLSARSMIQTLVDREKELRLYYDEIIRTSEEQQKLIGERTAQLDEANAKLNPLLENAPDLISTISRQKKVTYINRVIPGFTMDQVIGANCLDFVPEAYRTAYDRMLDDAILRGLSGSMDLPVVGDTIWQVRIVPVLKDGDFQQILVISTDITATRRNEKQLEQTREVAITASRAKSAFLANMSHEIRTPLSSIIGFGDLLAASTPNMNQVQANYCERIQVNSRHLLNLVNDVLDISKIEAGSVALENESFGLGDLLEDVIKMFSAQASSKNLKLRNRSVDFSEIYLLGDAQRLRQILVNLVGNAIKFTDHGEIILKAELLPGRQRKKTLLQVKVSDTGCGIDRENARFLFEPFEQENISVSKKHGGTGLGLFLSRNLARIMGGDVLLADSSLGQGSTFVVKIEFESSTQSPVNQQDQTATLAPARRTAGAKILIAEDNPDQSFLMQTRLENLGFNLIFAPDGEAAIKAGIEESPDMIIMDLQMPKMDGFTAARELFRLDYKGPIVALTAHANEQERSRCENLNFSEYWAKPISSIQLLEGIDRILSAKTDKYRNAAKTPAV